MSTTTTPLPRYKLIFYVPYPSLSLCKSAIFAAGAGSYPGGKYTQTCFEIPGTGQFLPNNSAKPNIGEVGKLERVEEMRVETICVGRDVVEKAVDALKKAHPYEEVAYEVYRMEDVWIKRWCVDHWPFCCCMVILTAPLELSHCLCRRYLKSLREHLSQQHQNLHFQGAGLACFAEIPADASVAKQQRDRWARNDNRRSKLFYQCYPSLKENKNKPLYTPCTLWLTH